MVACSTSQYCGKFAIFTQLSRARVTTLAECTLRSGGFHRTRGRFALLTVVVIQLFDQRGHRFPDRDLDRAHFQYSIGEEDRWSVTFEHETPSLILWEIIEILLLYQLFQSSQPHGLSRHYCLPLSEIDDDSSVFTMACITPRSIVVLSIAICPLQYIHYAYCSYSNTRAMPL